MQLLATTSLFVVTAIAEIVGCYLPYLWLRHGRSPLLLIPAAVSLAAFAWLLTLHPTAAGRVYAAYGGVYRGACVVMGRGWCSTYPLGLVGRGPLPGGNERDDARSTGMSRH